LLTASKGIYSLEINRQGKASEGWPSKDYRVP